MCQLSRMPLKPTWKWLTWKWPFIRSKTGLLYQNIQQSVKTVKTVSEVSVDRIACQHNRKQYQVVVFHIVLVDCWLLWLLPDNSISPHIMPQHGTPSSGSRFSKFYVITSKFLLDKKTFVLIYVHRATKCDQSDFLPMFNLYLTFSWQSEQIFRYFHPHKKLIYDSSTCGDK